MISMAFIIFTAITILLWLYLRHSLKRNVINLFSLNHRWIWAFDFLFFFSGSSRYAYRFQNSYLNTPLYYYLINASYILLGFLGLLIINFIILDIRNFFAYFFHRPNVTSIDLSRRNFFKKNIALTGLATSTLISGAGYANSFDPKIKTIHIPLPPEHHNLDGLKIVQLSDIHIGRTLKKDFCEMLVTKVNALSPDLIVITGDMVDGRVEFMANDLSPLLNLKSKIGTFFVTGNHEYYWEVDEWIDWIRKSQMTALENENIKLNYNGAHFYLAGINDPTSIRLNKKSQPNPKKAAKGIPIEAYKILLAHQPNACFQAVKAGFHTQLSGHTHGGQGFPWNIIVSMVQPYVRGLNNHEGMNVYVHSGTGFWGPPNRFMIDSEIAEIIFISTKRNS